MKDLKKWTDEEDYFLKMNYMDHNDKEMGEAIGRTAIAIKSRRLYLRLTKIPEKKIAQNPENKICAICGKELPKTAFSKHKQHKDGYLNCCKDCYNAKVREERIEKKVKKKLKEIEKNKNEIAEKYYKCTKCGKVKKGSEFYFLKSRNRRNSACIECELKRREIGRKNKIKKIIEGKAW